MIQKKRLVSLLMALVLSFSIVGCGMFMPAVVDVVETEVVSLQVIPELAPNLTVEEVAQAISETEIVIVDVREDWEFDSGHIEDAVLIPVGEIADRVDEIPTDVPVVLVCRSGNRSGQAYRYLKQQGFDNVHNMLGGKLDWSSQGYDVEY